MAQEKIVAVGCFAICWTLFEVAQIASRPIFDGLVNDVVPRPLLGRFFGLFRAVGLIDGMIFNFWIMGLVRSHFTLIMAVAGLTYGTSFIWVCLKVKEGEYPPPPPKEEAAPLRGFLVEVRRYFRECFSQPFYLSVFVLIMTAGLCFMPFNILACRTPITWASIWAPTARRSPSAISFRSASPILWDRWRTAFILCGWREACSSRSSQ